MAAILRDCLSISPRLVDKPLYSFTAIYETLVPEYMMG